MFRYFIELSFKGTDYSGWQIQPNAITIQEFIELSLLKLLAKPVKVTGCGRTDAGVHASQFYLHFDFDTKIDSKSFIFRMNNILPDSISFKRILSVAPDLHARFDAIRRSYTYFISFRKDPFRNDFFWRYPFAGKPDISLMNRACKILLNYNQFYTFSKSNTDVNTYRCELQRAEWSMVNDLLVFNISSDRFLRGMVRLIVGMCINVSREKISLEQLKNALENQCLLDRPYSVPAGGLFLSEVVYPGIN